MISWLNWKHYDDEIRGAFNSFEGQACFGKYHVDGYSAKTKTIFQFRGCMYHAHIAPGEYH